MQILKTVLTAILSVLALFVITKLMGHKQVSQLDFFDYINGITIGSIGAELATELETPEKPLIALIIYGIASLILNFVAHRLPRSRKYINGAPTVLMNNGTLYRKNLKKAKLDLSEFMLLCRDKGYFDLEEIETAVFEHNGRLSILPRAENRPATPKDMDISPPMAEMGVEVVMDGRVMGENLAACGRDEKWLKHELSKLGITDTRALFLAVYHKKNNKLKVYNAEE